VKRKAHADWVSSINAAADKNGVTQTPTMLINGKSVDIANLTPETLEAMITSASHR
jgi:protein-disulfide isomerase